MHKSLKFLLPAAAVLILAGASRLIPRLEAQAFSSPMRDVDNPARQPVFFSPTLILGFHGGSPVNFYQVPPGKRLIITYIGFFGGSQGTLRAMTVSAHPANQPATSQVVTSMSGTKGGDFVASQQVFLFGNPGDQVDATLIDSGDSPLGPYQTSMITGYLVNLP